MMQKIPKTSLQKSIFAIIFVSFFLTNLASAATIAPPSLDAVMKKNEQFEKTKPIVRENPSINIGSTFNKKITYQMIGTGSAVTIKRANEENLWIQEIHLDQGATIGSILVGNGYDAIEDGGEPLFQKLTLSEMRDSLSREPFSIINGQFFDPNIQPTRLSFGLVMDGEIRSVGADNGTTAKNILLISSDSAQIVPYTTWEQLRDTSASLAVVGLSLNAEYYTHENIGRTYICVKNPDTEGRSTTLLIFTAESMSEYNTENEMLRQGCTRNASVKMDASGSTRLWYNDEYIFGVSRSGSPDKRRIPHALVIYDASLFRRDR